MQPQNSFRCSLEPASGPYSQQENSVHNLLSVMAAYRQQHASPFCTRRGVVFILSAARNKFSKIL